MRRSSISVILTLCLFAIVFNNSSKAAEKRDIETVAIQDLMKDAQLNMKGSGDKHIALGMWFPNEFWESVLSRDASTPESGKRALLDALHGVTLFAVVQADVTRLGAFLYYTREEVQSTMIIGFSGANREKHVMRPIDEINEDLEVVLGVFQPILGSAMGNLGTNMHFFVLDNKTDGLEQLVDPYLEGSMSLQLAKKNGDALSGSISLPLNSLFIPRKCPNGQDADISWKFCPWTGEKLDD